MNERDLADFGLVQVFAYHRSTATLLNALADYLAAKGVRAVNVAGIGAPTRLFKYVRLANRGLSIPSTVYLPPRLLPGAYHDLAMQLDLPFVLKTVTGGRRGRTSLVGSELAFTEELRDTDNARGFLAQELVPPDGSYFLLVLGGHVSFALQHRSMGAAIYWRNRVGRTPLSSTHKAWIRRHKRPLCRLRRHWGTTSPVSTSSGIGRLGNGVSWT